ncbi:MAG: hypothetical protein CFK52_01170 [Chloracidobacterium sp. CP2_5A]|nr:MAG: hypothetical protein CFK52_01170 [Chloracidobacterium sp. CP2_5A]
MVGRHGKRHRKILKTLRWQPLSRLCRNLRGRRLRAASVYVKIARGAGDRPSSQPRSTIMSNRIQPVSFEAVNGHRAAEVQPGDLPTPSSPSRIRRLTREALRFLPNLLKLAYCLARDPRVPQADKIILAATIAYVIAPLDVIPDFIPFFGQIDDGYLVAVALLRLLNRTPSEALAEHWEGPGDIRRLLNRMVALTTLLLPRRVQRVVVGKVEPLARS